MASSSNSEGAIPPWLELPREITAKIMHRLGSLETLKTAQNVCKSWRSVCQDPSMWRSIDMTSWGWSLDLEDMCCRAVYLSQGQLTDISLGNFQPNSVLVYISERSSQLKHLRLVGPCLISNEVMFEAAKKFPLLEEVHLYDTSFGIDTIKAIGQSCPLLKSFKLNTHWFGFPPAYDLEAVAIAETMPELRYLELFGNRMSNEGLQAILDGCPHLESLDLRRCENVNLFGDLERLCSQRIKDLRHPNDSADDYEFRIEMLCGGSSPWNEFDEDGFDLDGDRFSEGYFGSP